MFYVAIYKNQQVSNPYKSRQDAERHNSYRVSDLHTIVSAHTREDLDAEVKRVLRTINGR